MQIKNIKSLILTAAIVISGLAGAQSVHAETNIETRIVGGTESGATEWPWMVLLSTSNESNGPNPTYPLIPGIPDFFCGASLISEQWILTAAHCVVGKSAAGVFGFVGLHDKNDTSVPASVISQIIVHPDYDSNTSDNDIALLKLNTPVTGALTLTFADATSAMSLLPTNDVSVIGWGDTEIVDPVTLTSYPDILRDVTMPYLSNADCNATMNGQVTDNMMCAGVPQGGVDSCQGDSGGPLVFSNDGGASWIQAGIVSWGYGCADPNMYGVYTRVENYSDWVQRAINGVTPSIRFGTWIPGKTATAQINIDNSNGPDFTISSITSSNLVFDLIHDCPITTVLSAGNSCVINLTFAQSTVNTYSGNILINTDHPKLGIAEVDVAASLTTATTFFNMLDADSSIQWALGGDNSWTEQQVTTDGTYSFQSGNIYDNQKSSLFAYVNVASGSASRNVYFDWKACSEVEYDFLELWVDNKKIDARSGNADWSRKLVNIVGAGDHVIEWRYNKDYVVSYGADAGWIDNIELDSSSGNPLPVHIAACPPAESAPPSNSGGSAMSPWFYLGFGLPLLMRRRLKVL